MTCCYITPSALWSILASFRRFVLVLQHTAFTVLVHSHLLCSSNSRRLLSALIILLYLPATTQPADKVSD